MTGNWYCVPSSCGRVVYREYLPPVVRWRYPGEEWQEIIADDYELVDQILDPHNYVVYWEATVKWRYLYLSANDPNAYITRDYTADSLRFGSYNVGIQEGMPLFNTIVVPDFNNSRLNIPYEQKNSQGQITTNFYNLYVSSSYRPIEFTLTKQCYVNPAVHPRICGLINPQKNCIFTITKGNQIVYEETRSVCPEVEKLPCRLSDKTKQIKIKKLPYLERIEVVDYAYDVRWGLLTDSNNYGLLLFKGQIPDNCLNIYENNITSIIPNDFIFITNTPENGFNLIAQICSVPGCPPPEYQVICDCNCESCPDNTCPVECGDHICCYGDDGIAVKSILIDSYCGD